MHRAVDGDARAALSGGRGRSGPPTERIVTNVVMGYV
jgi:hypothetical protein